jgi:hypothetical protein
MAAGAVSGISGRVRKDLYDKIFLKGQSCEIHNVIFYFSPSDILEGNCPFFWSHRQHNQRKVS